MPKVSALYRYPVKSFTPESTDSLTILPDGRIAGDRVLGFRFADTPEADDEWSSKFGMLALVNTPGVARLRLHYDDAAERLQIKLDDALLVEDDLSAAGRKHITEAVGEFAASLDPGAIKGHPEHLPLRLIGDGHTPRYQDRPAGYVTMHGHASVEALGAALQDPEVSELRFRSNVSVEGLEPWEEQGWMGRRLRIGEVLFNVHIPIGRCLATHANPENGERDQPILTTLTRVIGQEQPTLAVALVPEGAGVIRLGDEVALADSTTAHCRWR